MLWCLLCLETPLPGHSGTTRGQEGLSFGPQGTSEPCHRQKQGECLTPPVWCWCEIPGAEPRPACAELQVLSPSSCSLHSGLTARAACAQMPGAACPLLGADTAGEAVPHLKRPEQWFALAEGKLEGCSGWEAAHGRRGKKGSVHSLAVLRWRQLSLTVTSGEISS